MRTWMRSKVTLLFIVLGLLLAVPAVALASDLTGSVVDTTAPTGSVTLTAGNSGNIEINWSVTGKQDGTSTFKVYKDWTLSGGTITGSNPQTVTVAPRPVANAAATTGTINGTVSVDGGQAAGGPFALNVTAFDITNSVNTAKLSAGTFSTYNVTVQGVTDPCAGVTDPAAPVIAATPNSPNGSNGWYTSVPSISATTTTSGATIEYATKVLPDGTKSAFSSTAPILGEGTTEVFAKATSATCDRVSESSSVFMVDTVAPEVNPADVVNNTWRNSDLSQTFTSSDLTSGLADEANDASFTLTASDESLDADNPTVDERTVYDVAGNSTTRSVSALIDRTSPQLNISGAASGTAYNVCNAAPIQPTFDPSDPPSGLDGTEDDDWTVPTNGLGTYTYTAHATDLAGNATEETRTYTRTYGSAYKGLQQPINAGSTPRSVFKLGSTVPLKFFLACASGPITNATATFSITKVDSQPDGSVNETAVELPASSGTQFRLADATTGQYIFNLSTKSLTQGTYNLKVDLGDGSDPRTTQVMFDLKK